MTEKEKREFLMSVYFARWGGKPPSKWIFILQTFSLILFIILVVVVMNVRNGAL